MVNFFLCLYTRFYFTAIKQLNNLRHLQLIAIDIAGYNAVGPSAHDSLPPASHHHPSAGEAFSSPYGSTGHEAVAADSNISAQYTSVTAAAVNTTPTSVHTNTGKRRIFKRKHPIVPILTVHKVTRQANQ